MFVEERRAILRSLRETIRNYEVCGLLRRVPSGRVVPHTLLMIPRGGSSKTTLGASFLMIPSL